MLWKGEEMLQAFSFSAFQGCYFRKKYLKKTIHIFIWIAQSLFNVLCYNYYLAPCVGIYIVFAAEVAWRMCYNLPVHNLRLALTFVCFCPKELRMASTSTCGKRKFGDFNLDPVDTSCNLLPLRAEASSTVQLGMIIECLCMWLVRCTCDCYVSCNYKCKRNSRRPKGTLVYCCGFYL